VAAAFADAFGKIGEPPAPSHFLVRGYKTVGGS